MLHAYSDALVKTHNCQRTSNHHTFCKKTHCRLKTACQLHAFHCTHIYIYSYTLTMTEYSMQTPLPPRQAQMHSITIAATTHTTHYSKRYIYSTTAPLSLERASCTAHHTCCCWCASSGRSLSIFIAFSCLSASAASSPISTSAP